MNRADRVLQAWLGVIDPANGLTPESYSGSNWTVANSAADHYSSLVMIAGFTDQVALNGTLAQALVTEQQYAERIGHLPDDLDINTLQFLQSSPSLSRSIYGASEWCRDGLLRITENQGMGTAWADRLVVLADEVMTRATFSTPYGLIPAGDHEIDGEMLQTLSRLYYATGEQKYLTWAKRIGDYHFFDDRPQDSTHLRLRDHGGEIIGGLTELFVLTSQVDPDKAESYRAPLQELLDRVIEVAQAPDGMIYDIVNLRDGIVIDNSIIDTWGYIYNAHLAYDMITGENRYRAEVEKALGSLPDHYMDRIWGGSDDYADTIESAIVLNNRIGVDGIEEWIANTIPRMWAMQNPDGTVNRLYDDGSFARTSILYAELLSQGVRTDNWREDIALGAAMVDDDLYLIISTDQPWTGNLLFADEFELPFDYPRINELPNWYQVSETATYKITLNGGEPFFVSGEDLLGGLPVDLSDDELEARFILEMMTPGDANSDGTVDATDAAILAAHWQTMSVATWAMGDFNDDGNIDDSDATILAANWQATAGGSTASVPEPGTITLLFSVIGSVFLALHRQKK